MQRMQRSYLKQIVLEPKLRYFVKLFHSLSQRHASMREILSKRHIPEIKFVFYMYESIIVKVILLKDL